MSKLYPSDSFLVCSDGCTLIMMAAMNNRTEVLRKLVKMDHSPLDFKQMKVRHARESVHVHSLEPVSLLLLGILSWDNVHVKIS